MKRILIALMMLLSVQGFAQIKAAYENDEAERLYRVNGVTELFRKGDTYFLAIDMKESTVKGDIHVAGAKVMKGKAWLSLGKGKDEAIGTVDILINALKQEKGRFEIADGDDTVTLEVLMTNGTKRIVGKHSRLEGTFDIHKTGLKLVRSILNKQDR